MFAVVSQNVWLERLAEKLIELRIDTDVILAIARAHQIDDWSHLYHAFKNCPPSLQKEMKEPWQYRVLSGEVKQFHEVYAKMKAPGGENALHYAFLSGSFDQVEKALSLGIPWNSTNNKGWNILHFAALSGEVNLFRKVRELERENKNLLPKAVQENKSLIHFAAYSGDTGVINHVLVDYVMMSDENLYKKDAQGATALNYALRRNAQSVFQILQKQGLTEMIDQDQFTFEQVSETKGVQLTRSK